MPLGMEVDLDPSDTVLDGNPAPLPKTGADPQFSAYVYCGQTAAWIKMPLGTMVGLGPANIALNPFHTTDSDKTKLFCRVGVGGVNRVGDSFQ